MLTASFFYDDSLKMPYFAGHKKSGIFCKIIGLSIFLVSIQ